MPEATIAIAEVTPTTAVSPLSRRRRLFALGVVLCVSFLHFIVSSTYYAVGRVAPYAPGMTSYRLMFALIAESTSLLVLWYVISEREGGWKSIGWDPSWNDILAGFGVLIVSLMATVPPALVFQSTYRSFTGHYLQPRDLRQMLGFSISAVSIAFVLVNPFFEELIVRAYTMSEVMDLGGSRLLAIVLSVGLQTSYHLYQGVARSIAVAATFTVFSIYFARTRKILPVIVAHFCIDAYALIRGS